MSGAGSKAPAMRRLAGEGRLQGSSEAKHRWNDYRRYVRAGGGGVVGRWPTE